MDFRTTVKTVGGDVLAERMFATRKEADAFVENLQSDGGVLDGLGMTVVVSVEEMCNGSWTTASRDLVRCRWRGRRRQGRRRG